MSIIEKKRRKKRGREKREKEKREENKLFFVKIRKKKEKLL